MTPLLPLKVQYEAVTSSKYPLNQVCAHPECFEEDGLTTHHAFGRQGGDHLFAKLLVNVNGVLRAWVVPQGIRLCGTGTTKHHGALESHEAKLVLEDDGTYAWWDREPSPVNRETAEEDPYWTLVGPLDPQPAQGLFKTKKPAAKKRKSAVEREDRETISLSIPTGFAKGGLVWDELFGKGKKDIPLGRVREVLGALRDETPVDGKKLDMRPEFEMIVDVTNSWLDLMAAVKEKP
jgi:hypothetical protein